MSHHLIQKDSVTFSNFLSQAALKSSSTAIEVGPRKKDCVTFLAFRGEFALLYTYFIKELGTFTRKLLSLK